MTLMICTHKCQLHRTINKGEVLEIPENRMKEGVIKSSFRLLKQEAAPKVPEITKAQDGLFPDANITKDQLKLRLDQLGINYPASAKKDELLKLYMSQVGAGKPGNPEPAGGNTPGDDDEGPEDTGPGEE